MEWVKEYWWVLIILFMVGLLVNVYKDLKRVDVKKYLDNKPKLPPHHDFNDKWDDEEDDWPKKK
ncbi:YpfN family protein [Rosenbergiella epipactidis]|uniref:YpfN family protein n=1 Tax=Rosenbergiella epipactidis TaxID=1544694 RepID=UPI001F4E9D0A|nr:YpfN family protein [Rosenbergiella epipactidis]